MHRGGAWFFKGDNDRAIKDYDEAIRLNPKYALAYEVREAARLRQRATQTADAYNNRGSVYFNKGDYDRAIKEFDESIRLNPNDAIAHYNRGTAWSNKGDKDRAIKDYDEAIRLDPKKVVA